MGRWIIPFFSLKTYPKKHQGFHEQASITNNLPNRLWDRINWV
jgi:hypothetical protein